VTAFYHMASTHQQSHNATYLGMSMLASFWSGHINNLASSAFQDNIAILSQSRALLRHGIGGPRSCTLKVMFLIRHDPTQTLQADNHIVQWQDYGIIISTNKSQNTPIGLNQLLRSSYKLSDGKQH